MYIDGRKRFAQRLFHSGVKGANPALKTVFGSQNMMPLMSKLELQSYIHLCESWSH